MKHDPALTVTYYLHVGFYTVTALIVTVIAAFAAASWDGFGVALFGGFAGSLWTLALLTALGLGPVERP